MTMGRYDGMDENKGSAWAVCTARGCEEPRADVCIKLDHNTMITLITTQWSHYSHPSDDFDHNSMIINLIFTLHNQFDQDCNQNTKWPHPAHTILHYLAPLASPHPSAWSSFSLGQAPCPLSIPLHLATLPLLPRYMHCIEWSMIGQPIEQPLFSDIEICVFSFIFWQCSYILITHFIFWSFTKACNAHCFARASFNWLVPVCFS